MNFLHKSLLLQWMLAQCRRDSGRDWQALHRREHDWYHAAPRPRSRWRLLAQWLEAHGPPGRPPLEHLPLLLALAGFALGASLMAGLLEIQPLQRINIWWWLLFAVALPLLAWLIGLWLGLRGPEQRLGWSLLIARLPDAWRAALNRPLLALTFQTLLQHFSLWFALGLLACFGAYLLLTDLAFGWASTLDIGATGVHRLVQALAWPWHALWPAAVPDLSLVEHSRFRHERPLGDLPGLSGQWWRFLLMCLLVYVLLPRILAYLWLRLRLARAQARLFRQDPCLAGWWQRLHLPLAERRSEPVRQASPESETTTGETEHALPPIDHLLCWNQWQPRWLEAARARLPRPLAKQDCTPAEQWPAQRGAAVLLLCQAWEPPTGELADFCERMQEAQVRVYLWPMPLPGMPAQRAAALHRSWELFMPQLPAGCHLLELSADED